MKVIKEKNHNEKYVEKWLTENGFDYEIRKQTLSRTEWKVSKDGIEDTLSIQLETDNIKACMEQYAKQFEQLKELLKLRKLAKGQ